MCGEHDINTFMPSGTSDSDLDVTQYMLATPAPNILKTEKAIFLHSHPHILKSGRLRPPVGRDVELNRKHYQGMTAHRCP